MIGVLTLTLVFSSVFAQYKPGWIVRECTSTTGRSILNPNYATLDTTIGVTKYHFASKTRSGWTS